MDRKERPIIFNSEMVKAILEGRKTQTRRVIKPQPSEVTTNGYGDKVDNKVIGTLQGVVKSTLEAYPDGFDAQYWLDNPIYIGKCPYGKTGDRLNVVREMTEEEQCHEHTHLVLEITDIRVERVQDISHKDATAEGCFGGEGSRTDSVINFVGLWNSIYGKDAWDKNDWVWVIEFKKTGG